jgi:hypothetical protein
MHRKNINSVSGDELIQAFRDLGISPGIGQRTLERRMEQTLGVWLTDMALLFNALTRRGPYIAVRELGRPEENRELLQADSAKAQVGRLGGRAR